MHYRCAMMLWGDVKMFESIDKVMDSLLKAGYLSHRKMAATIFLAGKMKKPLMVEGPAGVGKTELAGALAKSLGTDLLRLQCYPGLDENKALYEWNYQKQLLYIQARNLDWKDLQSDLYSPDFLLARPVLKAFTSPKPVVLLIDEVDKSDEELESFLLEALSDFQVSIPEYGTVKAKHIPFVIITSNNTRELSDALKRRCIHMYIHLPTPEQEETIIHLNLPDINRNLSRQVAEFVSTIRKMSLKKTPGIAETIDWARALLLLGVSGLDHGAVSDTLNILLKYEDDITKVTSKLEGLIPPPADAVPPVPAGKKPGDSFPNIPDCPRDEIKDRLSRFDF